MCSLPLRGLAGLPRVESALAIRQSSQSTGGGGKGEGGSESVRQTRPDQSRNWSRRMPTGPRPTIHAVPTRSSTRTHTDSHAGIRQWLLSLAPANPMLLAGPALHRLSDVWDAGHTICRREGSRAARRCMQLHSPMALQWPTPAADRSLLEVGGRFSRQRHPQQQHSTGSDAPHCADRETP